MAEIIASMYEILDRLGAGGGGVVYLAKHLRLDKLVVLKADKRDLSTKPEVLRREVDALKNLSHTYIPQVYDFFAENGIVYTVMDYIEGESLDKPLKRGEVFKQSDVIRFGCEALEALAYLHSPTHGDPPKGIVHSDIKPANIMLTPQGHIRLIDFNIALALGEENVIGRSAGYASPEHYGLDYSSETPIMEHTATGNAKSTVPMSDGDSTQTIPMQSSEVSSSSKKTVIPDARSDIYSLGATLYHLLCGTRPAKDSLEVVPLSVSRFSPQIVEIITRAMNPNPDLRFQSAEEMLRAFRSLRENDPRTIRLKRETVIVSAALAVLLAAGAFVSFVGLKRMEMTQRALSLAEYSRNAYESGDRDLAVKYAMEALPERTNLFVPPHTAAAVNALANALEVYDLDDGYRHHRMIELPSEVFKTAISPDGRTGAAVYAFAVAVFDTESGRIMATLPTVHSALADAVFMDDRVLLYAGENGICAYDTVKNDELWCGKKATAIALSGDKKTVAALHRDEDFATVYDADGHEKATVSFDGNHQRVVDNDTFTDPNDSIFALNGDGRLLAVSFENGGLMLFDAADAENNIELYDESTYEIFEGGFYDRYFAFSSTEDGSSVFAVIDTEALEQVGGFELPSRVGVVTDENGIYISNDGTMVKIDPQSGDQTELAYMDQNVKTFVKDARYTVAVTEKNDYAFFDDNANIISRFSAGQKSCDFAAIAGDHALIGGRDTPQIRVLKQSAREGSDFFRYDPWYGHDEARISADGSRIMLFDYHGFQLYAKDGTLLCETEIPDADAVYDQQYSKKSGNLAVMYKDALRIYAGDTGKLLTEETGLKSVFFAPYGISVYGQDGTLRLIDADSGKAVLTEMADGAFAAYCGTVVDERVLDGGTLIGACRHQAGYLYAVAADGYCSVYDESNNKLFTVPVGEQSEAFFTDNAVILSAMHGTPVVYGLKNGSRIAELEKDAYLAYITDAGAYVVSDYVSASGERYALLLDQTTYEPVAELPSLCDISGNQLYFDYRKGKLRTTFLYSEKELTDAASRRSGGS